jgi:hypothetical protein
MRLGHRLLGQLSALSGLGKRSAGKRMPEGAIAIPGTNFENYLGLLGCLAQCEQIRVASLGLFKPTQIWALQ